MGYFKSNNYIICDVVMETKKPRHGKCVLPLLLGHVWPQTIMNIARHKTLNLLKALRAVFL